MPRDPDAYWWVKAKHRRYRQIRVKDGLALVKAGKRKIAGYPPGRCENCGWEWPAGVFKTGRRFCSEPCSRGSETMLPSPGQHGRRPIPNRPAVVEALRAKQQNRCGLCGRPLGDHVHVDHIKPLSKGGSHTLRNWQLAHPACNLAKGNRR